VLSPPLVRGPRPAPWAARLRLRFLGLRAAFGTCGRHAERAGQHTPSWDTLPTSLPSPASSGRRGAARGAQAAGRGQGGGVPEPSRRPRSRSDDPANSPPSRGDGTAPQPRAFGTRPADTWGSYAYRAQVRSSRASRGELEKAERPSRADISIMRALAKLILPAPRCCPKESTQPVQEAGARSTASWELLSSGPSVRAAQRTRYLTPRQSAQQAVYSNTERLRERGRRQQPKRASCGRELSWRARPAARRPSASRAAAAVPALPRLVEARPSRTSSSRHAREAPGLRSPPTMHAHHQPAWPVPSAQFARRTDPRHVHGPSFNSDARRPPCRTTSPAPPGPRSARPQSASTPLGSGDQVAGDHGSPGSAGTQQEPELARRSGRRRHPHGYFVRSQFAPSPTRTRAGWPNQCCQARQEQAEHRVSASGLGRCTRSPRRHTAPAPRAACRH
jgi:hypothetical protein